MLQVKQKFYKSTTPIKFGVCLGLTLGLTACNLEKSDSTLTVYAPASLATVIDEVNHAYYQAYATKVQTSYASSGTLAKQIENNAPVDIFLSADTAWLAYLQQKKYVQKHTNLLGNRLVLITPKDTPTATPIHHNAAFSPSQFDGKFCIGNPKSVPAGKYAKQALTHLGLWNDITPHLVETEDVRSVLNFVNIGDCQLGAVYATDAKIASNVQVVGTFPEESHSPIIYPAALIKSNSESERYYLFLQSATAKAIYQKYGFSVL